MIYLSKPHGTHAVFRSTTSQGAYEIHLLEPGHGYTGGPDRDTFVGERDYLNDAQEWANLCDRQHGGSILLKRAES